MKLNLVLVNAKDVDSINNINSEIQVSGQETLGWLLVKLATSHNLAINMDGFFRTFVIASNRYTLFNGPDLSVVSNLKKPIKELFSNESYIYMREFMRAKPFTPENPENKDDLVLLEYARVQSLIDNPITPNTLKNITLGFIKANIKYYKAKIDNLPQDLLVDIIKADKKTGNVITCKKK